MRKVYYFHQLPKKAKVVAAKHVSEKEGYERTPDWSLDFACITENLKKELEKMGLDVSKGLNWESCYRTPVFVDLSKVTITDGFVQNVLSKEKYKLYKILDELSDGFLRHRLFDPDYEREGYRLTFDYPYSTFNEYHAMRFIVNYSDKEEVKAKYQFPLLLDASLPEQEQAELTSETMELAEQLTYLVGMEIEVQINELLAKLKRKIRDSLDYLGTKEYYYEQLDAQNYPKNHYLFNYQGEIILYKAKFMKEEYEEKYHDAA